MKMIVIAALVAAQLPIAAGSAQAAELAREAPATQPQLPGRAPLAEEVAIGRDGQAAALQVDDKRASPRASAAQEDEPRKRKSTGDKVLTGAAVVLGVAALAVGGLLVAIFVN